MAYGFVYVLRNGAMPGLYKVGMTEGSPTKRAMELSASSGVPMPFEVICYAEVSDCQTAERDLHEELGEFRFSNNREFFRCPILLIAQILEACEYTMHFMGQDVNWADYREKGYFDDFVWPPEYALEDATPALEPPTIAATPNVEPAEQE